MCTTSTKLEYDKESQLPYMICVTHNCTYYLTSIYQKPTCSWLCLTFSSTWTCSVQKGRLYIITMFNNKEMLHRECNTSECWHIFTNEHWNNITPYNTHSNSICEPFNYSRWAHANKWISSIHCKVKLKEYIRLSLT